jgi:hypothetical protein
MCECECECECARGAWLLAFEGVHWRSLDPPSNTLGVYLRIFFTKMIIRFLGIIVAAL